MPFYTFRQNNSGGSFDPPVLTYLIEAPSPNVANAIAEDNGVYFNGCDSDRDCSCCGDRWSSVSEGDGNPVPSVYGTPIEEIIIEDDFMKSMYEGMVNRVVYLDRTTKDYPA